ncbi:acyltransferase family protein [Gluconobacter kondonii]|uniref:acyltransferase family protein n=1 Tax=Gluconobacter kondonii TaxID=941463 RepID=UPI001B8BA161|nr:acyltransferase [Gluconobacter kondonii]MBS1055224.1 acyltransferase [Gluconobacter kondonii]
MLNSNKSNISVGHIKQIDGLKAIAIAIVLCSHIGLRGVRKINNLNSTGSIFFSPYQWLPHGEIAVDIFFVLSGIVIGLFFLKRSPKDWNLAQFYKRRFWRIYPPYLITVICCAALLFKHINNVFGNILISSLYLNGIILDSPSPFNPPFWSLEVEIEFYIFIPFLMLMYRVPKKTKSCILVTALSISLVAFILSVFHTYYPFDGRFRFAFPAHLHFFMAGIILADIILNKSNSKSRRFDILFISSLVAIYGSGLWLTCVNAEPQNIFSWFMTAIVITLIIYGLVIGGIRGYGLVNFFLTLGFVKW